MVLTWSEGNQRGLDHLPGSNADCGQFAAGGVAGNYRVGSIDWRPPYDEQPPAPISPLAFSQLHATDGAGFRNALVPPRAPAVAFVVYRNDGTTGFHYARIEGDVIIQTDANSADQPGMGGTFINFSANMNTIRGQRGVQPARTLQHLGEFVDYASRLTDWNLRTSTSADSVNDGPNQDWPESACVGDRGRIGRDGGGPNCSRSIGAEVRYRPYRVLSQTCRVDMRYPRM
jgi:hypothetical protein